MIYEHNNRCAFKSNRSHIQSWIIANVIKTSNSRLAKSGALSLDSRHRMA